MPRSVLVVSPHAPETEPRLGIHHVVEALAEIFDRVDVVAIHDRATAEAPRGSAWIAVSEERTADRHRRCFSWTPWPGAGVAGPVRRWLTTARLDRDSGAPCTPFDALARAADVVIVETDLAAALLGRLRRCAPRAEIIAYASDPLDYKSGRRSKSMLEHHAASVDKVVVCARTMIPRLAALFADRLVFVPPGLEPTTSDRPPLPAGCNVVALGSPLFDASVLHIAATSLPEARFHLIESSGGHRFPSNVSEYATMPTREANSFLRHGSIGVAAFVERDGCEALADASPALTVLGHFGVPAVCPQFATGESLLRVGYEPGRSASIRAALHHALGMPRGQRREPALSWREVVERMLAPAPSRHLSHPPLRQGESAS